jgi:hypothetical protein
VGTIAQGRSRWGTGRLLVGCVLGLAAAGCQTAVPWWERETQLDQHGVLDLRTKPWWTRATQLADGQQFTVKSQEPGGGWMLVKRERLTGRRANQSAIVWVIDDDGDMVMSPKVAPGVALHMADPNVAPGVGLDEGEAAPKVAGDAALRVRGPQCDQDSDCYVVDYGGDGLVDRMVDYIDNNRDGVPDEMDIRYFVKGELRRAWFWEDLDGDGKMWSLSNYEYSANCFTSDPYGNNMLYMNRYDSERRCWWPISECPFAFYDTKGNGQSGAVVRFSAAPIRFDPEKDADFANDAGRYEGPFYPELRTIGVVNIRYSIDMDNLNSAETPLHYDMGFNMVGKQPYEFAGMRHTNPLRRSPKTTICARHADCRRISETYPAEQTGFSWREFEDGTIAIGNPGGVEKGSRVEKGFSTQGQSPFQDWRWEGVFWIWGRRIMHNTGGPVQRWNVRREFCPTPSTRRELYYSEIDRRIHLKGATDGWIEIGCLGDKEPIGEMRMFDTNGDGYFERWEMYLADRAAPARVCTARDPRAKVLPADWKRVQAFYTGKVLPDAIAADEKLIAAMAEVEPFTPPASLTKALALATCAAERRYVLDVIRELHYVSLREALEDRSEGMLDRAGADADDLRGRREMLDTSTRGWGLARTLAEMDQAYGEGRFERVCSMLEALAKEN